MSMRLWLDSLLSPDVTIEGRRVPVPVHDPFGFVAMSNFYARQDELRMQMINTAREKQKAAEKRCRDEQNRIMAAIVAEQCAKQDRPPVRQGRDL